MNAKVIQKLIKTMRLLRTIENSYFNFELRFAIMTPLYEDFSIQYFFLLLSFIPSLLQMQAFCKYFQLLSLNSQFIA